MVNQTDLILADNTELDKEQESKLKAMTQELYKNYILSGLF